MKGEAEWDTLHLPHLHWEKVMYNSLRCEVIFELGNSRLSIISS